MEEQLIDVGFQQHRYDRALAALKESHTIRPRNRELLLRFLRDASLGKTVIKRAKKKVGPGRLLNYIIHLSIIIDYLKMDLDRVTQEEMEAFIEALENDEIRARERVPGGLNIVVQGRKLSPQYKVDIKVTVRKFYKWLWGESKAYPRIVEWIDTYLEEKEISALTEAEVGKMMDLARNPRQGAVIQVLFDGGFRIQELLNVRLRHVVVREFGPENEAQKCFVVRVPFSKTQKRTVVLLRHETTKWLKLWLNDHPAQPAVRQDGTIDAQDVSTQLFPMRADSVRRVLRIAGQKALRKRVYPHLMRHSSATYWVNRGMSYFQLCKRFGWTMTSRMPQRYIDREGVDELKNAEQFLEHEVVGRVANEHASVPLLGMNDHQGRFTLAEVDERREIFRDVDSRAVQEMIDPHVPVSNRRQLGQFNGIGLQSPRGQSSRRPRRLTTHAAKV